MKWTDEDGKDSTAEGWYYFSSSAGPRGPYQKRDVEGDKRFKTDDEVYNHILEGKSRVCRKAREHILSELFK